MPGIEPGAFHMQSERSTAELHPRLMHLNISVFMNTLSVQFHPQLKK